MITQIGARKVADHAGATAGDLLQLGCSARLMLGTGRLVAEWAAEAAQLSASPDHARQEVNKLVANQLFALATLVAELDIRGMLDIFAAQMLPPQALLAWLHAVVGRQHSVALCESDERSGQDRWS